MNKVKGMIIYNPDESNLTFFGNKMNEIILAEEPTFTKVVNSITECIQLLEDEKLRAKMPK